MIDSNLHSHDTLRRIDAMLYDMTNKRGVRMRERCAALRILWCVRVAALLALMVGMWTLTEHLQTNGAMALFCAFTNLASAVSLIRTSEQMAKKVHQCDTNIEVTVKELIELRNRVQQAVADESHSNREEGCMDPL